MKPSLVEKHQRCEQVNELLRVIASCGRQFFRGKRGESTRFAYMGVSSQGHIYFYDLYPVYTHYEGDWNKFQYGGTLQCFVKKLRDYIRSGEKVGDYSLGPWPEWVNGGDLWGYGDDMHLVREAAVKLGIYKDYAPTSTSNS